MNKTPLYQEVYNDIKQKITQQVWKAGDKIPTEHELAGEYDVSIITIKSALNLLVTEHIIYRVAGKGSFVMEKENKKQIGFIANGLGSPYGMQFIRRLEHTLRTMGYSMILHFSDEDTELEKKLLQNFHDSGVDGIVIFPVQDKFHNPVLVQLILKDFPVVIVDRALEHIDSLFAGTGNYAAACKMTERILALGHRNISIVSHVNHNNTTIGKRRSAIMDTLLAHGVTGEDIYEIDTLESDFVFMGTAPSEEAVGSDIARIQTFIHTHPEITCFFCLNFGCAEVVYHALWKMGKRIPEDYSIVCFDMPDSLILADFFTYIRQDENALADAAAGLIDDAITGKEIEKRQVEIEDVIIENRSLGRARHLPARRQK